MRYLLVQKVDTMKKSTLMILSGCLVVLLLCSPGFGDMNGNPPSTPVKLIFIHHSVGEGWLSDDNGGLAKALGENSYFVSDTYYGWGPDGIGDRTDIPDWLEWFRYPENTGVMNAVYTESDDDAAGWDYYNRPFPDPGGENEIIVFKSCFPNSNLEGRPDDPAGNEPGMSVSGAKYVYNTILDYFASRPDKLFIAITPPPDCDPGSSKNGRAFSEWLVKDWLSDYPGVNVGVFDLHAILSSPDNHHQVSGGEISYVNTHGDGTCAYPTDDAHPNALGNVKATREFIPLLNMYYNRWVGAKGVIPVQEPASQIPPVVPTLTSQPAVVSEEVFDEPTPSPVIGTPLLTGTEDLPGVWDLYADDDSVITRGSGSAGFEEGSDQVCVDISVVPGGWASVEQLFDTPADWSGSDAISFRLNTDNPDAEFRWAVYSGTGHEDKKTYYTEIRNEPGQNDSVITIPFSDLHADDGESRFDSASVVGYYFAFGEGLSGTWCFSDIRPQ